MVLISVDDWVETRAIVRPEGLSQRESQMTLSEIETPDLQNCSLIPQSVE